MRIYLTLCFVVASLSQKPILELDLKVTENYVLTAGFKLGESAVPVKIDLQWDGINICCKEKFTVFQQVYFFLLNPYHQDEDYPCQLSPNFHYQSGSALYHDTAQFSMIGPLDVSFTQSVYSNCERGRLGMSQDSRLMQLMPQGKWFAIEHGELNDRYRLRIGGKVPQQPVLPDYINDIDQTAWRFQVDSVVFDGFQLDAAKVSLISSQYHIAVPSSVYQLAVGRLTLNYMCTMTGEAYQSKVYCPCESGISSNFPSFTFKVANIKLKVPPQRYMTQSDEVCQVRISLDPTDSYSLNFMMLDKTDLLFDCEQHRIGVWSHPYSPSSKEPTNEPMQLILNSTVILILCLLVGMVVIEGVKQLTSVDEADDRSFEEYFEGQGE